MRVVGLLWERVARFPFWGRLVLKSLVFGAVVLIVLYPNPVLFVKQIERYFNIESLIQPDFAAISMINGDIDAELTAQASPQDEFLVIQQYVYRHIRYKYDWENWGNIDFWPSAEQVWQRKSEDCDGRAVLAASILRSRGFKTARLVGNIRHIWVSVDQQELMRPDKDRHITQKNGKTRLALPSASIMLSGLTIYMSEFPMIRNLLLLFIGIVLCYHPCKKVLPFLGFFFLGLIGFFLLKFWAQEMIQHEIASLDEYFLSGGGLLMCSCLLSLAAQKIPVCKSWKRNRHYRK